MPRGKPKGAQVTSRPTVLLEEREKVAGMFEESRETGKKWMEPGGLSLRCNERLAAGWVLERIVDTGGNEFIFLWKRRE
jgi:hypothetical protein